MLIKKTILKSDHFPGIVLYNQSNLNKNNREHTKSFSMFYYIALNKKQVYLLLYIRLYSIDSNNYINCSLS